MRTGCLLVQLTPLRPRPFSKQILSAFNQAGMKRDLRRVALSSYHPCPSTPRQGISCCLDINEVISPTRRPLAQDSHSAFGYFQPRGEMRLHLKDPLGSVSDKSVVVKWGINLFNNLRVKLNKISRPVANSPEIKTRSS